MTNFFLVHEGKLTLWDVGDEWIEIIELAEAALYQASPGLRFQLIFDTEHTSPGAKLIPVPAEQAFVVELINPDGSYRVFVFRDEGEAMQFFLTTGVTFATAVGAILQHRGEKHFEG